MKEVYNCAFEMPEFKDDEIQPEHDVHTCNECGKRYLTIDNDDSDFDLGNCRMYRCRCQFNVPKKFWKREEIEEADWHRW